MTSCFGKLGGLVALAASMMLATSSVRTAQAQEDPALARCAAITDPAARLACYDSFQAPATTAAPGRERAPHWPEFNARAPAPPVPRAARPSSTALTARVAQFALSPAGRFTVTLDNGQVWRQLESDDGHAQFRKKTGNVVRISRGFWGSYDLTLNGGNIVFKVVRAK